MNYQEKRRIRRRGPPLQKRRQKIHTKSDKTPSCPPEGCEFGLANRKHEAPISIPAAPLYMVEKEEIASAKLLPQITSEEIAKIARDNTQHAMKYRSLENEENPVEELKGEAEGNELLDQSPQADGDDDYGQAQEEMTQNGVKSSIEEAEANGEQILRQSEENLALVEKRHKRKCEQNNSGTGGGKQPDEGRLNKKPLLVNDNEVNYEDGKRRCCNKFPNYSKNKLFAINSDGITDSAEEDKEYGQDTVALMEEETISDDSEDAEEQEAITEDNPSEVEGGENKMEEGNLHKIQQRSELVGDKCPFRRAQKEKQALEQKTQKLASAYENRQALKGLSKTWRTARGAARKEGQPKKNAGSQGFLSLASPELYKHTGHFSSNADDGKSSLKGRSEEEEGGERDEEETLDSENVGDALESNNRASVLGNKNEQQQAFNQDIDEQNLEAQPAINEQNEALERDEVQEEASGTKYERRQAAVDEQGAAESNLEESENEESQAEESETPQKRQVAKGGLEKEESKQAVADEQLESLSSYGASASEKNEGKIIVKRAEHSERQTEETRQAQADNDKESGETESETSSLETSEENQSLEGDNLEEERDKRELRNKGSSNNEKIAKLSQDSEVKIEQEHLQPQAEMRVQRELSKSENNNETPLKGSQSLEQEGSKGLNAEQQVSLSESAEEQHGSLTEERETSNIASSETVDGLTRENRDVGKQDSPKIKCCRNKNQPSLAKANDLETAEVAPEAETDTQSSLEDEKLSAAGERSIVAHQETAEASVEEYQELEPNSEDVGAEELQPERENGKE